MKKSKLIDAVPDPPDWQSIALAAGYELRPAPQAADEFSVREWADFQGKKGTTGTKRFLDGEVAAGRMTSRKAILPNGKHGAVYRMVKPLPKGTS